MACINKYGDHIYEYDNFNMSDLDSNKSVFVKAKKRINCNENLKLLYINSGIFLYGNKKAEKYFPSLIDGRIISIEAIVIVSAGLNKYVIGVKDICTNWTGPIRGTVEKNESIEECLYREIEEETGIVSKDIVWKNKSRVLKYDRYEYGLKFQSVAHQFFVHVKMTQNRLNDLRNYCSAEIEKVSLVPVCQFSKKNQTGFNHLQEYVIRAVLKRFKIIK